MCKKLVLFLLIITVVFLGASIQSTFAQVTAQEQGGNQPNTIKGNAALKSLDGKIKRHCEFSEHAVYYAKSPCRGEGATKVQLADQTKITSEEIVAFSKARKNVLRFYQERIKIYKELGSDGDKKDAELFELKALNKIQKNDQNLYEGKITWGQYNQERIAITKELDEHRKK